MTRPEVILCFFASVFLFIQCQFDKNPCALSKETLTDIYELDSIINDPETRELQKWNIENFNEPILFIEQNETYRFKRITSFETIEFYRIVKEKEFYKGIVKIFDTNNFELIHGQEKEISKEVWHSIVSKLETNNFWTYPSRSKELNGWEGTIWILEGFKPIKDKCTFKNYHVITRINTQDSILKSMCNPFFKIKEFSSNE